ncbi:MAG: polyprenyl diphosphate synthase [Actinobacteria bacterium]|nr:polyprenyl diphosphate synthase [Actinomycetota bacterium]MCI0678651.1 polyprenyl diphosphate synthase [Actinomycetota bacterium]
MALGLLYRLYEHRLFAGLDRDRLPSHLGIVLDGHRRHAREEGLSSYQESYREGMRRFEDFLAWADELGIPVVTAWLLSRENLARPVDELDPYFDVLVELFERLPSFSERHDMSIKVIGSLDLLPDHLVSAAKHAQEARPDGRMRLNIAMGYGGRQEIVDAAKDLVSDLVSSGVEASDLVAHIDAGSLAAHMYSADTPDPDLLIRTSGESRLSGFLLWQSAYSEFVFVDVNWPAFRRVDFLRALRDYVGRERRFGK